MNGQLLKLAERIQTELTEVERLVDRAQKAWSLFEKSGEDVYLDSVAINLHSFYKG